MGMWLGVSGPAPLTHEERVQRWLGRIVIDAETGCWLWQGARDNKGYASANKPRGEAPRIVRVHRVFYEEFGGAIPEDHVLHHRCEVRHCVYPNHLLPLTRGEHLDEHDITERAARATRERSERGCIHGHPWTVENTYHASNGQRFCRACGRIRANKLWAEKRYARQHA